MPLQGDLKDFGTPEVFQFLEQHAKSGCLQIDIEAGSAEVYFRSGKIVGVLPGGRNVGEQVLGILCRLAYLSEEEAERIRRLRESDLRGIRKILQQEGIVDPRELDELFRQQIEELVFPLLRMKRGRFSFEPDSYLPSDLEFLEPLAVQPLVLDGLRRIDEWPLLRKRVGSFEDVPQRRFAPRPRGKSPWRDSLLSLLGRKHKLPEDTAPSRDAPPEEQDPTADLDLSSPERVVFGLIDGRKSIEDIIRSSALGEYVTCKALVSLLDRGWVRIDSSGSLPIPGHPPADVGLSAPRRAFRVVLTSAALLGVLFAIALTFRTSPGAVWQGFQSKGSLFRLLNQQRRERVLEALELYRREQGQYPERLTDLVKERILRPDDLSLVGLSDFSYFLETGQSFRLHVTPAEPGRKEPS